MSLPGKLTFFLATWQSETAQAHSRGKLVMIEGMLITAGITISYWLNYGSFCYANISRELQLIPTRSGMDWR